MSIPRIFGRFEYYILAPLLTVLASCTTTVRHDLYRVQNSVRSFFYGPQQQNRQYAFMYRTPSARPYSFSPQYHYSVPATQKPRTTAKPAVSKIVKKTSLPKAVPPKTRGASASASQLLGEIGVRSRFVSPAALNRASHPPMNPTFITIHSTGNPNMKAGEYAVAMSKGLPSVRRVGATGRGMLSWHFTVDDTFDIQHLSTSQQGGHADFNGPGNRTSIGIEMCEYKGVDLNSVIDRTAKLTAYLMKKHGIPLSHVVPHYHWPRAGMKPSHKACPHFLMDGGKPGPKWAAFKNRVNAHYHRLNAG